MAVYSTNAELVAIAPFAETDFETKFPGALGYSPLKESLKGCEITKQPELDSYMAVATWSVEDAEIKGELNDAIVRTVQALEATGALVNLELRVADHTGLRVFSYGSDNQHLIVQYGLPGGDLSAPETVRDLNQ